MKFLIQSRNILLCLVASSGIAWGEGKTWALVVGIDEYLRPSIPALRYAVTDAKLFARALQDTMKVPQQQIYVMTSDSVDPDNQPRVVNIAYRLGWLKGKMGPDDTLVFYFAGHGVTVEGQSFLLTEEADNRSASTLKVSALQGSDIASGVRATRASNVWLVLDACRNTAGAQAPAEIDDAGRDILSKQKLGEQNSATMFSCRTGERSWESDEIKHGYFTFHLVEGLRMRAADESGNITPQRLAEHVKVQVKAAVSKLGHTQEPVHTIASSATQPWLLAKVDGPVQLTTRNSGPANDTAKYIAQLEIVQAKLDRETALRIQAEQRAKIEESQRLELGQRLAILEKQMGGKEGLAQSKSAPVTLAYAGRDLQTNEVTQALKDEIRRLQTENSELQRRLTALQSDVRQVGVAPRDVKILQEWNQAGSQVQRLQSVSKTASLQEQLQIQHQIREFQGQQVQWLEKNCGTALQQRPLAKAVATEVEFLREQVEIQRQAGFMYQAHLGAAESALEEAQLRLAEAEARVQKYEAIIGGLKEQVAAREAFIAQTEVKLEEVREAARDRLARNHQLTRKVMKLEDAVEDRRGGVNKNPWRITRRAFEAEFLETLIPQPDIRFED